MAICNPRALGAIGRRLKWPTLYTFYPRARGRSAGGDATKKAMLLLPTRARALFRGDETIPRGWSSTRAPWRPYAGSVTRLISFHPRAVRRNDARPVDHLGGRPSTRAVRRNCNDGAFGVVIVPSTHAP